MLNEQVRPYPSASAGPAMGVLLRMLERIELGSLLLMHGDCEWLLRGSKPGPEAALRVRNPRRLLSKVLLSGDIGFAESFMRGDWESPDLTRLRLRPTSRESA